MSLHNKAKELKKKSKDTEDMVLAIGEFYREHVKNDYIEAKDIIESRLTPAEEAYKKHLRSCGAAVNIAAKMLRVVGIKTKKISGETKFSVDHAWINVYLPEKKKWKEFDITREDGKVTDEYKKKTEVEEWEEIRVQLEKDKQSYHERLLNRERMAIFRTEKVDDEWIEMGAFKAEKELCKFFKFYWWVNKPKVFLLKDRSAFDALSFVKSKSWVVGRHFAGQMVLVIDYKNIEKESNHTNYTKKKYIKLIKHEMCHLFIKKLVGAYIPRWLDEGICLYVAKQHEDYKKPIKFVSFLDSYDQISPGLYGESGFVIQALIGKYGKGRLLKLLSLMRKNQVSNKEEFDAVFKKVYGFKISYKRINKTYTQG